MCGGGSTFEQKEFERHYPTYSDASVSRTGTDAFLSSRRAQKGMNADQRGSILTANIRNRFTEKKQSELTANRAAEAERAASKKKKDRRSTILTNVNSDNPATTLLGSVN